MAEPIEMHPRLSTVTPDKEIHSIHYYGPTLPESLSTLDLIPEGAPFNNAMQTMFPLTSGFNHDPSYHNEGWDGLMAFEYSPTIYADNKGQVWAVVRTPDRVDAYRIEDLLEFGRVSNPEETAPRMKGWIGATVPEDGKTLAIEYVPSNENIGLFNLPEHKIDYSQVGMTDVDLHVKNFAGMVRINEFGPYLSRIANLEADLRDVLQKDYFFKGVGPNPETEAWLQFLESKGYGPAREIRAIGVGKIPGMAAVHPDGDYATLIASPDIYQQALNIVRQMGLGESEEAVKFAKIASVWYHELYHVLDHRHLSEKQREADIGDLLHEFLSERASQVDEKTAKYYRGLARENALYAFGWRSGLIKGNRGKSLAERLENLTEQYALEAKSLGLNEDEAGDYITDRLKQEVEKLEESDLESKVEESELSKGETEEGTEEYAEKTDGYEGASDETEDGDAEEGAEESEGADASK